MLTPYEMIVIKEALDDRASKLSARGNDVRNMRRTGETLRIMQRCEKDIRTIEQIRGKL